MAQVGAARYAWKFAGGPFAFGKNIENKFSTPKDNIAFVLRKDFVSKISLPFDTLDTAR